jgi:hypothetical protein
VQDPSPQVCRLSHRRAPIPVLSKYWSTEPPAASSGVAFDDRSASHHKYFTQYRLIQYLS